MLTRSLILTVRWTYESVALSVSQINGDTRPNVARAENIATVLLMTIAGENYIHMVFQEWILIPGNIDSFNSNLRFGAVDSRWCSALCEA